MKKLIAISVMLALFTGIAFAQTSISGAVETRINVIEGVLEEENKPTTNSSIAAGYVQLSGRNEAGTMGGLIRVRQADTGFHRAFVWWRPKPEVRLFLGRDDDGMFSTGNALTDWAFHQGGEGHISRHDWGFWRSVFPGNWDKPGFAISYYGIEGLELNLVVPADGRFDIEDMYPFGLQFMGSYRIPDVGTILWSYIGSMNSMEKIDDPYEKANFGLAGISFLLTAVPGIRTQIGVSTNPALHGPTPPVRIGWGLHWASGNIGVKTRAAYVMRNSGDHEDGFNDFLTFNIMPHYTMGNVTVLCDFIIENNTANDFISWWVNPYIRYGNLRTGLMINSTTAEGANISYRLPIQAVFSF